MASGASLKPTGLLPQRCTGSLILLRARRIAHLILQDGGNSGCHYCSPPHWPQPFSGFQGIFWWQLSCQFLALRGETSKHEIGMRSRGENKSQSHLILDLAQGDKLHSIYKKLFNFVDNNLAQGKSSWFIGNHRLTYICLPESDGFKPY